MNTPHLHRLVRLSIWAIVLLPSSQLHAAPPIDLQSLRAWSVQTWSKDEGLPAYAVAAIAQTKDGYVWIGTDEALVRFDGSRMTLYDAESEAGLVTSRILDLSVAPDDTLWIGTEGGLSSFREGVFRPHDLPAGAAGDRVVALLSSSRGTTWVGTPDGLFRSTDGVRFERFPEAQKISAVRALAESPDGAIWVGTGNEGLLRCGDDSCRRIAAKGLESIRALHPAGKSAVWVGTQAAGLFRVSGSSIERWTTEDGLPNNSVYGLVEASDGSLWIGTNGGGVARYRGGVFETPRPGSGPGLARSMIQDREGGIWVASAASGVSRFARAQFTVVGSADSLGSDVVLAVYEAADGDLWVGTAGEGVSRFHQGKWRRYDTSTGLTSNIVLTIHGDREGNIWAGTSGGGLSRFQNERFTTIDIGDDQAREVVTAILPARDGSLWIGTSSSGLHRMANGRIVRIDDGSLRTHINTLLESSDGAVWIGMDGGGAARFSSNRLTIYQTASDGLRSDTVLALFEGPDRAIWMGTSGGGLSRWRDGKFATITKAEGLRENLVQQILADGQGFLWLGGNHGISRVRFDQLQAVADGRSRLVQSKTFGKGDGLLSEETNGGIFPSAWRAADGLLYFPTMKGLAITDPRMEVPSTPLRPLIEEVRTSRGRLDAPGGRVRLPPRTDRLEIAYSAPSFDNAEAILFRYRLDGFDSEWVEAGTSRVAQYTRIPPGHYTFRVAARDADGRWWEAPLPLPIDVAPAAYETTAFKIAMAALALLLALLIHRRLTHTLRRRHSALEQLMEERARAQESLHQSEAHFRMLIENASDLVMILEGDGRIVYLSPSAERILGRAEEEMIGVDLRTLLTPGDAALLDQTVFNALRLGDTATALVRIPLEDVPDRHLELVAQRLQFDHENDRLLINCRDITPRKLLEQRLEQANRIASLGRLATTIAHEFNNVLMSVRTMAAVLANSQPSRERTADLAQKIIDSVARGKRITDDILRFARDAEPDLATINLEEWAARLRSELQSLVGTGIELQISVSEPGLRVAADVQQLMQIFTNLALNAADAMPEGGSLTIHFRAANESERAALGLPGPFVHVEVRDTGKGIPPEVLPHIFEPLFTTKRSHGTGIGLAVVHQIIVKHGGHITVSSEVGKGTTFRMFLPSSSSVESRKTEDTAVHEESAEGLSILLVEDDPLVSEGLRMNLEMNGAVVEAVFSGREAIEAISRSRPDAVLLDVDLPDMTGVAVYEEIERIASGLPVIFSTGHADVTSLETFVRRKNVAFIRKPYDIAVVIAGFRKLVRENGTEAKKQE